MQSARNKFNDLDGKIKSSLGKPAEIRMSHYHHWMIKCKDLDQIATEGTEICEALKSQLGLQSLHQFNTIRLRNAYGDIQTTKEALLRKVAEIKCCREDPYPLGHLSTAKTCTA